MDLNFKLHDAQLEIFNSPARFKVVAAGRRFGKSYLSAVLLLIDALQTTNEHGYDLTDKETWYVAPTFQQAKDIMWSLLKKLGKDVIESTVENTGTLRLINGRKIQLKGSDRPDTLRGVGCSLVVLDEYAFMRPNVWDEIIFPTLSDVRGKALFIGTPSGKNHFFEIWESASKDESGMWESWHFTTTANPYIDPDLVAHAKDKLSSYTYRQEFEASFTTLGAGIFKEEYIKYSDEPDDGEFVIAVDLAGFGNQKDELRKGNLKRLDQTAIAVVKVHENGWWISEIDYGRWDIKETAQRILRKVSLYQTNVIGIEKGALHNAILPYMEDMMKVMNVYPRMEPLTHGGKKKEDRITWALQGRFEHGRISLKRGDWNKYFIEQLLDFPNPMVHDDLIDAVAYVDQLATTNYNWGLEWDDWEPLDLVAGL